TPATAWADPTCSIEPREGVTRSLDLVFKNCSPDGQVNLPTIGNARFGSPSMSTNMQVINFKMTRSATLSYPVRATNLGDLIIPSFQVQTTDGTKTVPEARYKVVKARVNSQFPSSAGGGAVQQTIDDVVKAALELEPKEVWAGQVFGATVVVQGLTRYFKGPRWTTPVWRPDDLVLGPWLKYEESRQTFRGQSLSRFDFPVRAMAPIEGGAFDLPQAEIAVVVNTGSRSRDAFDLMFGGRNRVVEINSNASQLKVKPLPATDLPFSGAVGEFELESKLVPGSAGVGEPLTWTVQLSGKGNWPAGIQLPNRQVPEGFEIIQPKSKTEMEGDSPFIGKMIEDVVLIPQKEGTFTLPALEFTYFDPLRGTYKTIKTKPEQITITPAKSRPGVSGLQVPQPGGGLGSQATSKVVPFDGQAQLPYDPLKGENRGGKPLPLWLFFGLVALPWIGFLVWWATLVRKRVIQRDAQRIRREAWTKLQAMANASGDMDASQLREWQRETVRLWEVPYPVPNTQTLSSAVDHHVNSNQSEVWSALWKESEACLFGKEKSLSSDWRPRFAQAMGEVSAPRVPWKGMLRPSAWIPVVMGMILILGEVGVAQEQKSGANYYQSGEFQRTEAESRRQLEENWSNWVAHHNLALSLFQQERWDEAAVHGSIAAVYAPSDATARWNARLLLERAGWDQTKPGILLLSRIWSSWWYLLLPASVWQWLVIFLSLSLASVFCWGLRASYQGSSGGSRTRWILASTLCVALFASGYALQKWGPFSDPGVVMIFKAVGGRSIPSDVDQQTRNIPTGTTAKLRGQFLGWHQIELNNAERVWIREREVVPVYRNLK
ncbi:MAG: BatD family protein, partial [Verrucomicrobiota bacterium]